MTVLSGLAEMLMADVTAVVVVAAAVADRSDAVVGGAVGVSG